MIHDGLTFTAGLATGLEVARECGRLTVTMPPDASPYQLGLGFALLPRALPVATDSRPCRGRQGRPDCARTGSAALDGHCVECFDAVTDDLVTAADVLAAEDDQPEDAALDEMLHPGGYRFGGVGSPGWLSGGYRPGGYRLPIYGRDDEPAADDDDGYRPPSERDRRIRARIDALYAAAAADDDDQPKPTGWRDHPGPGA